MITNMTRRSDHVAFDVLHLIGGALLFLSPWLLGFAGEATAAWNAWISGGLIGFAALGALIAFNKWQVWVSLILGVWALLAPWALNFANLGGATTAHVIIGAIIAIAAVVELWMTWDRPLSAT